MTTTASVHAFLSSRCTQPVLRRKLADQGSTVSRQLVRGWWLGAKPAPRYLPPLCSALALDTDGARELYRLAGVPLPDVLLGNAR